MSNEAIATQDSTVAVTSKHGMSVFNKLANPSNFLPYVRLYDPSTKECKRGLIAGGLFGAVKNRKIISLGKQFHCHLLAWRPKALHIPGGEKKPVSYFDPDSKEFNQALELCKIKDSGWMAGPEFLICIPDIGYCTFFMSNATMKNEASNVIDLVGKVVTFESKLIETQKYTWYGPETTICSLPIPALDYNEVETYRQPFLNPKPSVEEPAEESVPEGAKRAER